MNPSACAELWLIMLIRYYRAADAALSTKNARASELLPGSVILLELWGGKSSPPFFQIS